MIIIDQLLKLFYTIIMKLSDSTEYTPHSAPMLDTSKSAKYDKVEQMSESEEEKSTNLIKEQVKQKKIIH